MSALKSELESLTAKLEADVRDLTACAGGGGGLKMTPEVQLFQLEVKSWEALQCADKDATRGFYEGVLRDDAVMLFPGGKIISGKAAILDSIQDQPWDMFAMESEKTIMLSENVGTVVYKVTAKRPGSEYYHALVSSTYARGHGTAPWMLVLHQQTPT